VIHALPSNEFIESGVRRDGEECGHAAAPEEADEL
jgi:hypothetical protein